MIPRSLHGLVRVAAEDSIRILGFGVAECALRDFVRKPQPGRIQMIEVAREPFASEIKLLQLQVQHGAELAQGHVAEHETVELMSMNR